jgi:N-acetylneuraminic acid mutarotase
MIKRAIYIFTIVHCLVATARTQSAAWEELRPLPEPRYGAGAVLYDHQIYVIGGFDTNDRAVSTVSIYDPWADSWESNGRDLRIARANAAVVVYDDSIFVIGGVDSSGLPVASVEVYHRYMSGWKIHSQLNFPRLSLTAVKFNNIMYALGGQTNDADVRGDAEYWDASAKQWRVAENWTLNPPRLMMSSVVTDDAIFTLGGLFWDPIRRTERFTPKAGVELMSDMPEARYNFTASVAADTIYVIGGLTAGSNDINVSPTTLKYSIDKDVWIPTERSLDAAIYAHSAVTYFDHIYIFGGLEYRPLENAAVALDKVARLKIKIQATDVPPFKPNQPMQFRLLPNYPNPFNASTIITFQIEHPAADVRLGIINLRGEIVHTFGLGSLSAGSYPVIWHGQDSDGNDVVSGVYFYRLMVDGHVSVARKMMLLR